MTDPALIAVAPAPFVTLQDSGRRGWSRFGISTAGAMDPFALAAANALVGNPAHEAALEFAYGSGSWQVAAESCLLAVAGGAFRMRVDDRSVPAWTSTRAKRGQIVCIEGAPDAVWGYLAVCGGFALAPWLGSRSTHLRSGLGGVEGRVLAAGDTLPLARDTAPDGPLTILPREPAPAEPCLQRSAEPGLPRSADPGLQPVADTVVRAVLGPQDSCFAAEALHEFFSASFRVSMQCDRLGYCLEGPPLPHLGAPDIISDGVVPGSVQVPGTRQPIVLMRDCQPPGGYAKIATVISADVARIAQTRPGRTIAFRQTSVAEAQLLRRRYIDDLAGLPQRLVARADG